ncbi:MAG: cytochrome d ubiquinol oxidase subunit II [Melioribacteraceae bacterium]|nr:cytochrome d ubiquinol oxidase subunit II [Melioribacteraceae bacterium]
MEFTFDLNTIWFILIGVLLTGYAILDGFDLGVGSLHLLVKDDTERRLMMNSIGPVWTATKFGWLPAVVHCLPHSRMSMQRFSQDSIRRSCCC